MADEIAKAYVEEAIDAPGSDPAPFANLPGSISDIEKMSPEFANAWNKAFAARSKAF